MWIEKLWTKELHRIFGVFSDIENNIWDWEGNTVEQCITACRADGYLIAGLQVTLILEYRSNVMVYNTMFVTITKEPMYEHA